jgi:hypothetical protein
MIICFSTDSESPVPLEFTPFLGILAGIALTLLLSTLAILTIIRLKYRAKVATPPALPSQQDEEEYYPSPRPHPASSDNSSSGYGSAGGQTGKGPDIIMPANRTKGIIFFIYSTGAVPCSYSNISYGQTYVQRNVDVLCRNVL